MTDAIHEEVDDVAATMNAWRASVPSAVAFAPPLAADDAATAAVLAGMADWPVEHHAMGEHRESMATALHAATTATSVILTNADDAGAAGIAASQAT
ncbi:hypothetical protein [Mycobacterium pseudokansasii]|uniref:PE domain-containing protein n=2 Tax=Mycobacterium TaxID=1763 RepID=A0A498QZI1_9MYCO|nr:hypothetical protein [Mycobacterium pseudokansasii]ETZ98292.1 hypothetical protein I546_6953 [Mycobacterium kansasii 732]MBY0390230.1 hypothetical protein [Mycobacterium pseudokansasii]VBA55041.1 hypothetical protein LAUMK142_04928 [Mycobacterium pseudokansasii]